MKKKILFAFGTRPEAIKMVPVIKKALQDPVFEVKVLVTHQHKQMLDQVLEVFELTPDFDLDVMQADQQLWNLTTRILERSSEVFKTYKPDYILVHGDTTTTFAISLAAFYQKIPVAHVEAGLRTHDIYSPFPEEMNRQLTSKLASIHFAPTTKAKDNLLQEGVDGSKILVTGNTVIDTLFLACDILDKSTDLTKSNFKKRPYVLVTAHRRENFGTNIGQICLALQELARKFNDWDFVFPVHLNPQILGPVKASLGEIQNVKLIEPMEYLQFIEMMRGAYLILTDSGGVQEEAPSLGVPVLVMRENTERPEAVEAGTVKLVGASFERIVSEVSLLIENTDDYLKMKKAINPYGDGKATERILNFLKEHV